MHSSIISAVVLVRLISYQPCDFSFIYLWHYFSHLVHHTKTESNVWYFSSGASTVKWHKLQRRESRQSPMTILIKNTLICFNWNKWFLIQYVYLNKLKYNTVFLVVFFFRISSWYGFISEYFHQAAALHTWHSALINLVRDSSVGSSFQTRVVHMIIV